VTAKKRADAGDAEAQMKYGDYLAAGSQLPFGLGVFRNPVEAAKYYKLAADQGSEAAQIEYGRCLRDGKGVPVDVEGALRYFKFAGRQ
jgi:TPR repeat protein